MSEIINTLDRINGRFDIAQENISEIQDITIEVQSNRKRFKKKKEAKNVNRHV